ncbi:hypothetical protein ASF99_07975 [Exiguobacterium sp. Leaf187]|uniref:hypothetical protein n=1 Tax=Exiguobacterium sp. Leaf187 TaxID=1736294 RepID=UPI0006F8D547|nr:hypothetical protein [Exiguobacterium sp. Leaf187]KQS19814.1 hypothetical protein ASF99_07975 [Exiguobacterium sp. Leaf187]
MSSLMAKIKGEKEYKKILSIDSEIELFPEYRIDHVREYDPKYMLDEEEYFFIKEFSEQSYSIDIIKNEFSDVDYNTLNNINENKLEYIFWINGDNYFFQRVTPSQIVERKLISLKKNQLVEEGPNLVIKNRADAFYNKENDILYFKNLNTIKSIFFGIDFLFKEATEDEVNKFLESKFIKLEGDYNAKSVKTYNRKRISLVSGSLNQMNLQELYSTLKYVKSYCTNLKFDETDEKFILKSEEDLKSLIYGIDQRFYTTEVSRERRLANSVTKLTEN